MDYRLNTPEDRKISIQIYPSFDRVSLFDFSTGWILIAIPRPPQTKTNIKLWFTLFPPMASLLDQQSSVNGKTEIIQITINKGNQITRVGLIFLNLNLSATRALQKVINYYMPEEYNCNLSSQSYLT